MARLQHVVSTRTGHAYSSRFTAAIEGGPELAAALKRLDDAVSVKAAKAAVEAMGKIIADDWSDRYTHGPEPIHIADAVQVKSSKTKTGASGSVGIRRVSGPDDEQPALYARKLEFGTADYPAQPAARPAFDSKRQEAADAAEKVLRDAVMGVVR